MRDPRLLCPWAAKTAGHSSRATKVTAFLEFVTGLCTAGTGVGPAKK